MKSFARPLARWISRGELNRFLLFFIYAVIIGVVSVIIFIVSDNGKIALNSSDINSVPGNSATDESTVNTSYSYYLDISPTMYGFINGEDILADLAEIFESMNNSKNLVSFYCCGTEIMAETSAEFYGYMRSSVSLDAYYELLFGQADTTGTDDVIDVSTMDLSILFTDTYNDSTRFDNDDCVNVIITDLNFGYGSASQEESEALMEGFVEYLSDAVVDGSICIYGLDCYYDGFEMDEYLTTGTTIESASGYEFFLIVFSNNQTAYDSFVIDLEEQLETDDIDVSKKFEITEHTPESHELEVDSDIFHDISISTISNFNYDSKSYKRIESDALGLQLVKNGTDASAQILVSKVDLSGYYSTGENTETELKTVTQLLIAGAFGYEAYDNMDALVACDAVLVEYNDNWYIQMNLQVDGGLPDVMKLRRYGVLDVQISLAQPDYTIPEWVAAVNMDCWNGNYDEGALENLIERVESDKENAYSAKTSYEKYMGNIQIYIGC